MGHTETLDVLLGTGGDPMIGDIYKNTCVHCAAVEAQLSVLSLLLSWEAALPALRSRNADELLPLHQAATTGNARCVEVLLQVV